MHCTPTRLELKKAVKQLLDRFLFDTFQSQTLFCFLIYKCRSIDKVFALSWRLRVNVSRFDAERRAIVFVEMYYVPLLYTVHCMYYNALPHPDNTFWLRQVYTISIILLFVQLCSRGIRYVLSITEQAKFCLESVCRSKYRLPSVTTRLYVVNFCCVCTGIYKWKAHSRRRNFIHSSDRLHRRRKVSYPTLEIAMK